MLSAAETAVYAITGSGEEYGLLAFSVSEVVDTTRAVMPLLQPSNRPLERVQPKKALIHVNAMSALRLCVR